MAAQLNEMMDENSTLWEQLSSERRNVEKLVDVGGRLWNIVGQGVPWKLSVSFYLIVNSY